MATPLLNRASVDLSYKIQDPVSSYEINGKRVTSIGRLKYLQRGYERLLFFLDSSYKELYEKASQFLYGFYDGVSSPNGIVADESFDFHKIDEVVVKWKTSQVDQDEWVVAHVVSNSMLLSLKAERNKIYLPSRKLGRIFYAIGKDYLELLPNGEYNVGVTYVKSFPQLSYNSVDIEVTHDLYYPILAFAASEAYLDLGNSNFSQAYINDATLNLKILSEKKVEEEYR